MDFKFAGTVLPAVSTLRQKTILLIDEYDILLGQTFQHGYYNEMVSLIRRLFGGAAEKKVRLDLTYNEPDSSIDNLWSVLFTTGYLTQAGRAVNGVYKLVIPNRKVLKVFGSKSVLP